MKLTFGDDATIAFADLSTLAGVELGVWAADDVLTFALQVGSPVHGEVIAKSSEDGSVTFTATATTGAVTITAADWQGIDPIRRRMYDCTWQLKRRRNGLLTTVLEGEGIDIVPDVTP